MSESWRIERSRNGRPVLVDPSGRCRESRYRPDVEAGRRVREAEIEEGDSVLLIGACGGELPRAILRAIGSRGTLIVAEPSPDAFRALRDSESSCDLFADERVTWRVFGLGCDEAKDRIGVSEAAEDFLRWIAAREGIEVWIAHPGVAYPAALAGFEIYMADLDVRRRSAFRFRDVIRENLKANRESFLSAPGVSELRGILSGSTVVVAGGGPSLDTLAPRIGPSANWIAVGTALRPLRAHGVRPLLAVVTDPQPVVAEQIVAGMDEPPVVFFPTAAHGAVARSRRRFAAFATGDGGGALAPLRGEIGELPARGSVATTAIGLAILLGAGRICLAGVDFMERSGASHARGTYHEAREMASANRFGSIETGRVRGVGRSRRIVAADAAGIERSSRENLLIYARAVEAIAWSRPDIDFVQLSRDAFQLRGVRCAEPGSIPFLLDSVTLPEGVRTRRYAADYGKLDKR